MRKLLALAFIALTGLAWYLNITSIRKEPVEYQMHLTNAESFLEKGIYVDAIDEYEMALEYDKNNWEIKKKIAEAHLANGNSSKYISMAKDIAEHNQKDNEALDDLMNYYLENGNDTKAVKYIDSFVKKHPDNENAQKWYLSLKGSYSKLYCWFHEIGDIYNGYMPVMQDDKWGIADASGDEIISPMYLQANPFSTDGYALVEDEKGFKYVDKKGQTRLVPDSQYDNLGFFSLDGTISSVNGKYGILDETLQPKTEFEWDDATNIYKGIGAACKNGKWAVVDNSGKCLTDFIYDDVARDGGNFCSYQGILVVKIDGAYQLINTKGDRIGNLEFANALPFTLDGYAAVSNGNKWGFVDATGNLVIDYSYDQAQSFSNSLAAVSNDNLWGYIDSENHTVIPINLYRATPFSSMGSAVIQEEEGKDKLIKLNLNF